MLVISTLNLNRAIFLKDYHTKGENYLPNYMFVEQMKSNMGILTVGVTVNSDELDELTNNRDFDDEVLNILEGTISWEDASNGIKNFISLYIANLNKGPIKNIFSDTAYITPIELQLEQRQQSLEDFATDELIKGHSDSDCKVFIKGFYEKIYSQIDDINEDKNKSIGFILTNFLLWSESQNITQKLIRSAYKNELDEFQDYITQYPSLGAYHSTGKKIINAIRAMQPTTINTSTYFRAREVSESRVFSHNDLDAPESEYVTKEGRYNHIGIPVLYLASDKETCVSEMMEINESKLLWFQEFNVYNVRILDLTTKPGESISTQHSLLIAALIYEGVINQDSKRESVWKPEYYIPRFVADVTKMVGNFDGIKFSSNRGQGSNLALFNWEGKYSFLGNPKAGVYTRKVLFDSNTPPWKRDLYSMICPNCEQKISQLERQCHICGKPNPYYIMDDDL